MTEKTITLHIGANSAEKLVTALNMWINTVNGALGITNHPQILELLKELRNLRDGIRTAIDVTTGEK